MAFDRCEIKGLLTYLLTYLSYVVDDCFWHHWRAVSKTSLAQQRGFLASAHSAKCNIHSSRGYTIAFNLYIRHNRIIIWLMRITWWFARAYNICYRKLGASLSKLAINHTWKLMPVSRVVLDRFLNIVSQSSALRDFSSANSRSSATQSARTTFISEYGRWFESCSTKIVMRDWKRQPSSNNK